MSNYTGKTIFMGIDVHKKTYSVTVRCEGEIIKRDTLTASPTALVKYCQRFKGAHIKSAYEAGFCGFYLHRHLAANSIDNIVVHAAAIEVAARERVKTDKRDSQKIAQQLEAKRLNGIYIPSEEREMFRSLTRLREKLVRDKTRVGIQLKLLLHQYGMITPENDRRISKKWLNEIIQLGANPLLQIVIDEHIQHWMYLYDRIKHIEKEIDKQAEKDQEIEQVYRSVLGIGKTSSRVLANELGDTLQFSNEKKLFSYTGLTPREYSSGEHIRLGNISRQGKPILRKILIQASWKAVKIDPSLNEIFMRLSARCGAKKAIVGIARRLIGRVRACFRKGELYIPQDSVKN